MIEREVGEILTISVGTAIALEALMKSEKPIKHEHIFLNVRTLFRNFHGAIDDAEGKQLKRLKDEFLDELGQIKTAVETAIPGEITPVFYICSNASMSKMFKHAKLKAPSTSRQKNYASLERKVMEFIMESPLKRKIKIFDCVINGNNSKSLIMTHYPLELLSFKEFRSLELLESHTGVIKGRSEWNSKLTNPDAYRNLPFNILTLQLIGDQATQFNSLGAKYIKPIIEVSQKNNWTTATTNAKVKFDLDNYYDKLLVNLMKEMLSVKLK